MKHRAIREREARPDSQLGQFTRRLLGERDLGDVEGVEPALSLGQVMIPPPRRPDEELSEGERAGREVLGSVTLHECHRTLMMRVRGLEEPDEDARVEHDHSGQSLRSSSR